MPHRVVRFRRLVVMHYHLRPGGVRRVIELALPHIVAAKKRELSSVVLVAGEPAEADWWEDLRRRLGGVDARFVCEPSLRYFSRQRCKPEVLRHRMGVFLERLFPAGNGEKTLVWAHNLGLARNLILADALRRKAAEGRICLLSHHHDFWFENRWTRWREMRACGFRTLPVIARTIFGGCGGIATINRFDKTVLDRHVPDRVFWLPNLAARARLPSRTHARNVRQALTQFLGDDGPIWTVPARFLRRKNLAEAVLLTRWLRPEGWLVTTAGVSSPEERNYARRLDTAARRGGWRVKFRILSAENAGMASITELIGASETLLLTSVQEGFGLPCLDAAAFGKPLIARSLPNVLPDLKVLGFTFPHLYQDVLIARELIDIPRERTRQRALWRAWKSALPSACRRLAAGPPLAGANGDAPIPFSRLTLTAQLEVLALPPQESWMACRSLNPILRKCARLAASAQLTPTRWPIGADARIGGAAYAERFHAAAAQCPARPVSDHAAGKAQADFIAQRLASDFLYPILLE